MNDNLECTSCGKELAKNEEHNFYDCLEYVKKENADLQITIDNLNTVLGGVQIENAKLRDDLELKTAMVRDLKIDVADLRKQLEGLNKWREQALIEVDHLEVLDDVFLNDTNDQQSGN